MAGIAGDEDLQVNIETISNRVSGDKQFIC
jgi:hypothetical protein